MFADWDDYFDEDEAQDQAQDLVRRYNDMRCDNKRIFFDLYEFEGIIDFFLNEYSYQEALEAVNLAIDQHPYALSVKLMHIQILIESGKPSKALRIIREVEKTEQSNDQIFQLKGYALNITGKCHEAAGYFDQAIRLCYEGRDDLAYSIAHSFLQVSQYQLSFYGINIAFRVDAAFDVDSIFVFKGTHYQAYCINFSNMCKELIA